MFLVDGPGDANCYFVQGSAYASVSTLFVLFCRWRGGHSAVPGLALARIKFNVSGTILKNFGKTLLMYPETGSDVEILPDHLEIERVNRWIRPTIKIPVNVPNRGRPVNASADSKDGHHNRRTDRAGTKTGATRAFR